LGEENWEWGSRSKGKKRTGQHSSRFGSGSGKGKDGLGREERGRGKKRRREKKRNGRDRKARTISPLLLLKKDNWVFRKGEGEKEAEKDCSGKNGELPRRDQKNTRGERKDGAADCETVTGEGRFCEGRKKKPTKPRAARKRRHSGV